MRDEDVDQIDALHAHFKELLDRGAFDDSSDPEDLSVGWIKVADEGRLLWNRMFDRIEFDSPIHGFLYAVAAAAFEAGLRGVAARIGVTPFAVECAIEGGGRPPNVEKFLQDCREVDASVSRA